LEHTAPDRSSPDRAPAEEPGARSTRFDASPASDGRALAALAEIDSSLRDGEGAWKAVVRQLDVSRRQLAVAAVQLQMTRSLAARQSRREDDESDGRKRPDLVPGEEAHYARLLQQFEAGLTEAETRRVALHHETEGLRHRKQAALRQLSAPVRSGYEAALQAGRVPAITTVAGGVCSGCASRLPLAVVEACGRGAVVVCYGCARLLLPTEAR
jgi:predicted  nucleic acid-binding Zn-ribbon protein